MRMQAAPRIKRASTQQDERVAVLALSRVLQHVPTAMNRDSQDTPEVRV